jgi:hypothetical protein
MEQHPSEPRPARQPYEPPAVIYEAPLEVRAGSPAGLPGLPDWGDVAGA